MLKEDEFTDASKKAISFNSYGQSVSTLQDPVRFVTSHKSLLHFNFYEISHSDIHRCRNIFDNFFEAVVNEDFELFSRFLSEGYSINLQNEEVTFFYLSSNNL